MAFSDFAQLKRRAESIEVTCKVVGATGLLSGRGVADTIAEVALSHSPLVPTTTK